MGRQLVGKKVILYAILLPVLAAAAYMGVYVYKSLRNTPERTVQSFVQDLEAGNVEQAYARLTSELKKGREDYWQDYLAQFEAAEGAARLVSQEYVEDTFHSYPLEGNPQRFVYSFRLQARDYRLQIVTFKLQGTWVIAEVHGSFAE